MTTLNRPAANTVRRLAEMFIAHDPARLQEILAPDCRLFTADPSLSGGVITGAEACANHWGALIANTNVTFEIEGEVVATDAVIQFWRCVDRAGVPLQRGVNVFRVRGELITEAHGYVKAGQ